MQEIIRVQPRTAGVISLRGRLVSVRDIAARVGAGALTAAEPKIVVVELPGEPAGILVDGVDSVVTVAPAQLAPVPAELATDRFTAIAQLGGELVLVLDADRVLAGVRRDPGRAPEAKPEPRRRQPSRKRSEKATRSTAGAPTGSPSKVTA